MATTRTANRNSYVYGSAVRKIDLTTALDEKPSGLHQKEITSDKLRARVSGISFGYVLFMTVALLVTAYIFISYLKLQSEVTNYVDKIAYYEVELNNKTIANDDDYSKMIESVNLDEIRAVAINELGMVYASEDQIISYTRENSDYVRQVSDLTN